MLVSWLDPIGMQIELDHASQIYTVSKSTTPRISSIPPSPVEDDSSRKQDDLVFDILDAFSAVSRTVRKPGLVQRAFSGMLAELDQLETRLRKPSTPASSTLYTPGVQSPFVMPADFDSFEFKAIVLDHKAFFTGAPVTREQWAEWILGDVDRDLVCASVYCGGIEPAIRHLVWPILLNVQMGGLDEQYASLTAQWHDEMSEGESVSPTGDPNDIETIFERKRRIGIHF